MVSKKAFEMKQKIEKEINQYNEDAHFMYHYRICADCASLNIKEKWFSATVYCADCGLTREY